MDMTVNSVELANGAAALRKNADTMRGILDDCTQVVNGTSASWESAAAENLRSRYTSLSAKFSDFYDAITKYAKFLDNTAAAYENADKKIEQRAEELLNSGYNA